MKKATSKKRADEPAANTDTGTYIVLGTNYLFHSPTNPRKTYQEAEISELAGSIKTNGIINPITVRPENTYTSLKVELGWPSSTEVGDIDESEIRFEVVSGNRRLKAAIQAGLMDIPCIVRWLTDDQVLDVQIDENLHRADVPPLEEAEAFQSLLESKKFTVKDLADRVSKSQQYIYRRLKLNNLEDKYREHLIAGFLPVSVAEICCQYPKEVQRSIHKNTFYKDGEDIKYVDGRNMRQHFERETVQDLSRAWFPIDLSEMQPNLVACTACEKNTAVATLLFPQEGKAKCTDKACWKIKESIWKRLAVTEWEAYCAESGIKAEYMDLGWNFDTKEISELVGYEIKALDDADFDILPKKSKGAKEVLFFGANPWDDEAIELNYTRGWVKKTVIKKDENYVQRDWEMEQIDKNDKLTEEQKVEAKQNLTEERRIKNEIEKQQSYVKRLGQAIINKSFEQPTHKLTSDLMRLYLISRWTTSMFGRDIWLDVFRDQAKSWTPPSFAKNQKQPEWNDAVSSAWKAIIDGKDELKIFDLFNRLISDEDKNVFFNETFVFATDKQIDEFTAVTMLYESYQHTKTWGKILFEDPFKRYAASAGIAVATLTIKETEDDKEEDDFDDPYDDFDDIEE